MPLLQVWTTLQRSWRRAVERARDLWRRALREHTTPRELALSVGLGVFVGCTPFLGLHAGMALALATFFRVSRLWALIGSRVSFFLTLPWIVLAEIQVAHHLRTGAWAALSTRDAVDHAREWLFDWWLGVVPVGTVLAVLFGALAYGVAAVRRRRPSPAPPPSSESRS
jgi:uncharacterized protein (DUF2062 family)